MTDASKSRIMHVITALPTGGTETFLWKLLSATNGRYDQIVVSLGDQGTVGPRIAALGVPVHALGLRPTAPNPFRILPFRSLVRSFRPQLVQGWMYHGNIMASLAARYSGATPVFWNIQQSLYDLKHERRITALLIRMGAPRSRKVAAIIYNSRTSARQHESQGYDAGRSVVIPTGYDCQMFRPDEDARCQVREELGVASDAILVGLIARYHPMKDHAGFIKAAAEVAKQHPQVRFVMSGPDITRENPDFRKMLAEHGLVELVFLLGDRRDTPRLTAALDVACSASAWGEGFSNTVGEAMACGVPCVVTDVGDSAYIVADTGISVPPSNPEAFAQAISRLIAAGPEYRRQLGLAARQRVATEFSMSGVAAQYEDLYRRHLGRV